MNTIGGLKNENMVKIETKKSLHSSQVLSMNDIDENPDDIVIKREYSAKNENQALIYSINFTDFMDIIINHPKILDSLIS